jgi:hypothetical protein
MSLRGLCRSGDGRVDLTPGKQPVQDRLHNFCRLTSQRVRRRAGLPPSRQALRRDSTAAAACRRPSRELRQDVRLPRSDHRAPVEPPLSQRAAWRRRLRACGANLPLRQHWPPPRDHSGPAIDMAEWPC